MHNGGLGWDGLGKVNLLQAEVGLNWVGDLMGWIGS